MVGLFIVGCFVTAIVAVACGLIITGIRVDKAERERFDVEGPETIRSKNRA